MKKYTTPSLQILVLTCEDIITTSGGPANSDWNGKDALVGEEFTF